MQHMLYKHLKTESFVPVIVTALSVEFGNKSEDTCMLAPLVPRISLIFEPPLPISEPHWDAGIINLITMEDDFRPLFLFGFWISWNCEIIKLLN